MENKLIVTWGKGEGEGTVTEFGTYTYTLLYFLKSLEKSLLKHHNSKSSLLQCSAFFTVQLSHLYMTFGKSIALTIWTFD